MGPIMNLELSPSPSQPQTTCLLTYLIVVYYLLYKDFGTQYFLSTLLISTNGPLTYLLTCLLIRLLLIL